MSSDEQLQRVYDRIAPKFAVMNAAMPANLAELAGTLTPAIRGVRPAWTTGGKCSQRRPAFAGRILGS